MLCDHHTYLCGSLTGLDLVPDHLDFLNKEKRTFSCCFSDILSSLRDDLDNEDSGRLNSQLVTPGETLH